MCLTDTGENPLAPLVRSFIERLNKEVLSLETLTDPLEIETRVFLIQRLAEATYIRINNLTKRGAI